MAREAGSMDGHSFGVMIALKHGRPEEQDRDLTPEEIEKHGEKAAEEFAAALARHDHRGMFTAFKAMDALCEETDGSNGEADEE